MIRFLHLTDNLPFDLAAEVDLEPRRHISKQSCIPKTHYKIDVRLGCLSREYRCILKVKLNEQKLTREANNIPLKADIIAIYTTLIHKFNLYCSKFNHVFDKLLSKLLLILYDWLYPINLLLL